MKYFIYCFKHYADFKGRARRAEFWQFFLPMWILSIIINLIGYKMNSHWISFIFDLVTFLPITAVTVRRLHDIGRSGWWLVGLIICLSIFAFVAGDLTAAGNTFLGALSLLVCIGSIILLFVWNCLDSQPGPNHYGPNPKGVDNPEEPSQIEE